MTLAETILAVLDGDYEGKRAAFLAWIGDGMAKQSACSTRRAIASELCRSLFDDVAAMPVNACEQLGVPIGTTYARGADALFASHLRVRG